MLSHRKACAGPVALFFELSNGAWFPKSLWTWLTVTMPRYADVDEDPRAGSEKAGADFLVRRQL